MNWQQKLAEAQEKTKSADHVSSFDIYNLAATRHADNEQAMRIAELSSHQAAGTVPPPLVFSRPGPDPSKSEALEWSGYVRSDSPYERWR